MRYLHFRNARGDLQEGHFTLPDATCLSFRAQNRHFCALLPSETLVFGLFEHKIEVFVSERAIFPRFYPLSSTKSRFLCAFALQNPHFWAFRAQNRGFCVKMGDVSEILGCFDTKSAFLCSWMAAASPAVPAEAQQGPPELSTARHEPCGVHLAAVRPAIDCRNPLPSAPTTRPGRNVIAETFIIYGTFVSKNLVSWRPQLEARGR